MQKTDGLLARLPAADARLTLIDVATPMLHDVGEPRETIFISDGLHMTQAGYDIWRDCVWADPIDPESALANASMP